LASILDRLPHPPGLVFSGPDESIPDRRPAYLNEAPLFGGPPAPAFSEGLFRDLWARRDEADQWVRQEPYTAGMIRLAEARRAVPEARVFACELSVPAPATDPEAAYLLKRTVEGIADAASMFDVLFRDASLTGGPPAARINAVDITITSQEPLLGGVGDILAVVGRTTNDVSGSLLIGDAPSLPPPIDLIAEGRALEVARQTARWLAVARGGVLLTLARCCTRGLGARIVLPDSWQALQPAAALFGEAQSRFLAAIRPANLVLLQAEAAALDVPFEPIGTVGGDRLAVDGFIDIDVKELMGWRS
jgi:phosphoribosylformylglycinamidine (FGAM) synthase-like enzyme